MNEAYRFIRAYGRYIGLDMGSINRLVIEAQRTGQPRTVYGKTADGRWMDAATLEAQAARGSLVATYTLSKIHEYAGVTS